MSDAEDEDMEHEEEASSSGDGGSDGGSSDAGSGSGDGEEASSSEEEVEPRVLPNRTTRGSKMGQLVEEEDDADQEFWRQDFFQVPGCVYIIQAYCRSHESPLQSGWVHRCITLRLASVMLTQHFAWSQCSTCLHAGRGEGR